MSVVVTVEGLGADVKTEIIGAEVQGLANIDLAVNLQNELAIDPQSDLAVAVSPQWIGASAVSTFVVTGENA